MIEIVVGSQASLKLLAVVWVPVFWNSDHGLQCHFFPQSS